MASPTLTTMLVQSRLWGVDTSTSAPAATDAQWTIWINVALRWYWENTEKRTKEVLMLGSLSGGEGDIEADAGFIYPEIISVWLTISGLSSIGQPLDRMEWSELRLRQASTAPSAAPTHWAAIKEAGAGGKWRVGLLPTTNAADTVTALVRVYPVALASGSDVIDLGDAEADQVCIIAAIFAAPRIGRPELATDLMQLLPKMLQDKMTSHAVHDEVMQ